MTKQPASSSVPSSKITRALDELLQKDPVFAFLYRRVANSLTIDAVFSNAMAQYVSAYLNRASLTIGEGMKIYDSFIRSYNEDCKKFADTGRYPAQITGKIRELSRREYDVILLLSCLVSPHRYTMMKQLQDLTPAKGREAVFVGCGPGLEIALLKNRFSKIYGFDLSLNPDLPELIPGVEFYQELFPSPRVGQKVDAVYMIELLEHLDNPYDLLDAAAQALLPNGRIYLTTATNIPQFDHLYNFPENHKEFERRVGELGMEILENIEIPHSYMATGAGTALRAKNHLYILGGIEE